MNLDYATFERPTPVMTSRWMAPATCGELVQGFINGNDFLVNCPIRLYSQASIEPRAEPGLSVVNGDRYAKVQQALMKLKPHLGKDLRATIRLDSDIPRGKGMASSTADLTAALKAVIAMADVSLSTADFSELITTVEPSDCTHITGIAHVNHLTGRLYSQLPAPSNLCVIVVDCGGEIDTVAFDRDFARSVYADHQSELTGALGMLTAGLKLDRSDMIGAAATASARLSQKILFKPQLERLLRVTTEAGAVGINCAHSGTVIGVLYQQDQARGEQLDRIIADSFGDAVNILGHYPIISGGCIAY